MRLTWTELKKKNGHTLCVATRGPMAPGCTILATVQYVPGANLPWRWETPTEDGRVPAFPQAKRCAVATLKRCTHVPS